MKLQGIAEQCGYRENDDEGYTESDVILSLTDDLNLELEVLDDGDRTGISISVPLAELAEFFRATGIDLGKLLPAPEGVE